MSDGVGPVTSRWVSRIATMSSRGSLRQEVPEMPSQPKLPDVGPAPRRSISA
jgi:hypothetical protein